MSSIYEQVRAHFSSLIKQQRLKPYDKLPSERELVELFSSTRITIREALFRLESEGTIYRLNRKGWFVAPERFVIDPTKRCDFMQMAVDQKRLPETDVLHIQKKRPLADVKKSLNLKNASIYHLQRVRRLDGRAVMMEDIFFDSERFKDINSHNLNGSLSRVQREHYDVQYAREHCTMRIIALSNEQAEALEVNPGSPCLQIERLRFDTNGEPFDFNVEYWLHNAVEMEVDVR